MKFFILHIILILGISFSSHAQLKVTDLHYRNDSLDYSFVLESNIHSAVKPYVILEHNYRDNTSPSWSKVFFTKNQTVIVPQEPKYKLNVYPITSLSVGFDNYKDLTYDLGLGLGVDFGGENLFISAKYLPTYSKNNFFIDSIINTNFIYPGKGQKMVDNMYQNIDIIGAYKLNKFFTVLGGHSKNFFGDGYRSLLLSDNASSNPFLKLETSFASIKYVNLFQVLKDIYQVPNQHPANAIKYSASHYLSWNITKEFNLSVFETVVMQGKDSLSNRGFDVNYLNPFVFYRPVEHSSGSADNVLLGLNMSYKTRHQYQFYFQLILDEFLLAELKSDKKWWANKYGIQLGIKANDFIIKNLYIQAEYNFVRPFTYSHKHTAQNYGQMNQAIAHPIGANFHELVNIITYKKDKHQLSNKITYASYGLDTSAVNYGQNIFHSYSDRDGEYGHISQQGLKTNVFNNQLIYEYALFPKINIYGFARYNYRFQINGDNTQNNHSFQIGIKSRIWNNYTDY
jgi:hypothetical protein